VRALDELRGGHLLNRKSELAHAPVLDKEQVGVGEPSLES
jgi:hypothetical protein